MPDYSRKDFFNTRQFFEKTAHYASAARTVFSILQPPSKFKNLINGNANNLNSYNSAEKEMLKTGFRMLTEGIVAKSTTLPSQVLIRDTPFSYGGPTRKHAINQQFYDLVVEFYLMGATTLEARSLYFTFTEWHKIIAGPRMQSSTTEIPRSDSTMFAIEFYDNYVTDATVTIYSPTIETKFGEHRAQPMIKTQFSELYPITIGSLFTTWESQDIPLSLPITFAYFYNTSLISNEE